LEDRGLLGLRRGELLFLFFLASRLSAGELIVALDQLVLLLAVLGLLFRRKLLFLLGLLELHQGGLLIDIRRAG
jgi:hypothetical protein